MKKKDLVVLGGLLLLGSGKVFAKPEVIETPVSGVVPSGEVAQAKEEMGKWNPAIYHVDDSKLASAIAEIKKMMLINTGRIDMDGVFKLLDRAIRIGVQGEPINRYAQEFELYRVNPHHVIPFLT